MPAYADVLSREYRTRRPRPVEDISSRVGNLHPVVRATWENSMGTAYPSIRHAERASAAAQRDSDADARFNQLAYRRDTGRVPPPGYGYVGEAYMPQGERQAARTYWGAMSRMEVNPGQAPNVPVGGPVGYYGMGQKYLGPLYSPTGERLPMPKGAIGIHGTAGGAQQYPPIDTSRAEALRTAEMGGTPNFLQAPATPYQRFYAAGYGPPGVTPAPSGGLGYQIGQLAASGFGSALNLGQLAYRRLRGIPDQVAVTGAGTGAGY